MRPIPARHRLLAVTCALLTVISSAALLVGTAEARTVTQSDLDATAAAERDAAAALDAAEARLAQATADRDRYGESLARIEARQRGVAIETQTTTETVRDRIARMYMVAGAGAVQLSVDDTGTFATRLAYLAAIADSDRQSLLDLSFADIDLATAEMAARHGLKVAGQEVTDGTALVEARTADLAAARARRAAAMAEWQRQEAARKAALEAELRAQETALTSTTTTSTPASTTTTTTDPGSTTTTTVDTYGWDPKGGVEQWRPLVTRVFAEWGLDQEKCGPAGCVGPQIENALVIMRCESSGIPFATNGPDTEWGVVGLYQHRKIYWADRVARARSRGFSTLPADATPWNPEHNVIMAALLVWESRETLIGNLSFGRPWSDGPEPWGHWDGSSRYCAKPPLVTP